MNEELKDKFGDLKEDTGELFNALKSVVADKADDIKEDAKGIFGDLKESGSHAFNEAKDYVSEKISEIKKDGFSDEVKSDLKEDILDPASKALKEAREKVEGLFASENKEDSEPIEVDLSDGEEKDE